MNASRWFGASICVFAAVCLLGIVQNAELGAFGGADKNVDVKSTSPDKATVKPGDSQVVGVTLVRQKDAKKEATVKVEFDPKDKDKGLSADEAKVAADKTDAKVTIKTTDKTPAGDYKVTIKAESPDSKGASATFTLTVKPVEVVKTKPEVKPEVKPAGADVLPFKAFLPDTKPFYTIQTTKTEQKMTVLQQEVKQNQEQTFLILWTPKAKDKDNWVVEQQIKGVKLDIDIGGNKIKYYSPEKNPKNPMTDFFDQLQKQKLTYTIDPAKMAVAKVDGRDDFIKGLSDINPQMRSLLTAILSENALKKMAEPTWWAYPTDGKFTKDRKWEQSSDLDLGPIGKYKTDFTFTVKSVKADGSEATVDITTKLTYTAPGDEKKQGLPFVIKSAKLTGEGGTGTAIFNGAKGRFEKTDLKMTLTGSLEIEVGNMTTTVNLTQTQTATSDTKDEEPAGWKAQ